MFQRNASKFAIFYASKNPCSFFRFSFRATLYFYLMNALVYVDMDQRTLKFLDSKNASCLSKRLQHLQASAAFFLTFHDATSHMRGPFKYPPRIAHFWLVNACYLEWFEITPKNKQSLYENGQFLVGIQMGPHIRGSILKGQKKGCWGF